MYCKNLNLLFIDCSWIDLDPALIFVSATKASHNLTGLGPEKEKVHHEQNFKENKYCIR